MRASMHRRRLERLQARIRETDLAAVLIANPANLRYLTGFHSNAYSRPLCLVVPAAGPPGLLVPRLEELQARDMTGLGDIRSYVEWDEGSRAGGRLDAEWLALLAETLAERGLADGPLGLERGAVGAARESSLRARCPAVGWTDVGGWVEALRLVKDGEEIANHRRAAALAAAGLDAGFAAARASASELEIKGASLAATLAAGARQGPHLAVAAAGNALVGERIAAVHTPAGGRPARASEAVFVVLSASVDGSHCELSRTIIVGRAPTGEQRRSFRAVSRAHEAARGLLKPGTPARDLDQAARRALAEDGLAEFLPMRTGHGLGLQPVEAPDLGAGDLTPLQADMVVSIEPGVCIPGAGGVLWADNYVVTDRGAEALTAYPVEID
jgi:Xaa-Pro dipeptidase